MQIVTEEGFVTFLEVDLIQFLNKSYHRTKEAVRVTVFGGIKYETTPLENYDVIFR